MTFYMINFGCKTNRYDAVTMSLPLLDRGYREVSGPGEADLILINTCTVTARSDAKARASIRRLHRANPSASIVVAGCSVETQGELISNLPGVDLALGLHERSKLHYFLEGRVRSHTGSNAGSGIQADYWREGIDRFPGRSRAYLKIQEGCNNSCSYCVIPSVRGKSISRQSDHVIREAVKLLQAGHTELVLTGIHIGHYGWDLNDRTNLEVLVARLLDETDVPMLRLGSLNPDEISTGFLDLMASNKRIARHLHIPLQSGSDNVLASMARSYRSRKFEEVTTRATEYMPLINVGSDVIVGFPTESAMDFSETRRLIENLPVGYLHVFRYSDRTGTRASDLDKCATTEEVTRRAREIKKLGSKKKHNFHLSMVGKVLPAVYEREIGSGDHVYRSTNYIKVYAGEHVKSSDPLLFDIKGITRDGLAGSVV